VSISAPAAKKFSRRGAIVTGCVCLVLAALLTFAWEDRIFAHLHHEEASTEILEIQVDAPYQGADIKPAPAEGVDMPGGVVLQIQ
jgi:hypothetical protein